MRSVKNRIEVSSAVQSELGLLLNIECVRDLVLVGQVARSMSVCLSVFTRVCSMTATPCDCRVVCQKSTFQPPPPPPPFTNTHRGFFISSSLLFITHCVRPRSSTTGLDTYGSYPLPPPQTHAPPSVRGESAATKKLKLKNSH